MGTIAPTAAAYSTKTQATADRVRVVDSDSAPLALTDDQLDQIMRHAAVLHPGLRRAFVECVVYELREQTIGDGVVFRACAKAQSPKRAEKLAPELAPEGQRSVVFGGEQRGSGRR